MIKVFVEKQGNYPVSTPTLKKKVVKFFEDYGVVSNAEVSIAIVGEAKMLSYSRKYLKDNNLHNVLSFTNDEIGEKFVYPPDGIIHLGEVIVCYPKAFEEAKLEGKLIDDKVTELTLHGALHLLGIHHE
jgi:probable rRNA maturation factor